MQVWLKAAEPIAIACTALDGICAAVGIALGKWVDDQTADDSPDNDGATTLVIGDGTFEVKTTTSLSATASIRDPALMLARAGQKITLTTGAGASITLRRGAPSPSQPRRSRSRVPTSRSSNRPPARVPGIWRPGPSPIDMEQPLSDRAETAPSAALRRLALLARLRPAFR